MNPERWRRIEELFHAALDVPPSGRATFLANASGDDEELRREVWSLLEQSDPAGGILSRVVVGHSAVMVDTRPGLHAGQVFGAYCLQGLLGSGGMGEVYLAHDTKLGRDVAVKVLPQEFTSDKDRLARFEREARMLATLNHPNICGIYGFDEADGVRFLVLELVDGETLAARLGPARDRLSFPDALEIARQIADALEAAHERGVIHRDLKPSNIKITPSQLVKVLDFGLAKSVATIGSAPDLTHVPSGVADDTAGMVMGTAAYMSPEQARGVGVDKRTDIWSFGVVLFEMFAGRRPFRGENSTDTLAAILKTEPDWSELPATIPAEVLRLLDRCLEKDPKRRLQSIAEARVQIENVLRSGDSGSVGMNGSESQLQRHRLASNATQVKVAWSTAAGAAVLAAVFAWLSLQQPAEPEFHFPVLPPAGGSLVTEESPAISPDGSLVALVAYDPGGTQRLYVATLDGSHPAEPLTNTEGASLPFWSPASNALGFFAQGSLKTIDLATRGVRRLANAGGPRGGTWGPDGVIVYVPSPMGGAYRISSSGEGGDAKPVPGPSPRPGGWFPSFLPDGRHFLEFVPTVARPENPGVWLVTLESGERVRLIDSRSNAMYARGHLWFWREETLWVQPFDERLLSVHGNPTRVAGGVGLNPVTNQALFSASSSGTLTYYAGPVGETELVWLDRRSGREFGRPGVIGATSTIALSPDETSVVYDQVDRTTGTFDIWRRVFTRPTAERLTLNQSNDVFPLWSPDGVHVTFMSVRERPPQIYQMTASSTGSEIRLFKSPFPVVPSGWSTDGKKLFYTTIDASTATGDIWSVALDTGVSIPIAPTPNDERYATPSPVGQWVAYVSNESGVYEVYVAGLDGILGRTQISRGGGLQPQWRRDGRELIYLAPDRALMSVAINQEAAAYTSEPPRRLFFTRTKSIENQGTVRTYAMSSDGQRFLVANATEEAKAAYITVVKHLSVLER